MLTGWSFRKSLSSIITEDGMDGLTRGLEYRLAAEFGLHVSYLIFSKIAEKFLL
jgi:hypothetical protein